VAKNLPISMLQGDLDHLKSKSHHNQWKLAPVVPEQPTAPAALIPPVPSEIQFESEPEPEPKPEPKDDDESVSSDSEEPEPEQDDEPEEEEPEPEQGDEIEEEEKEDLDPPEVPPTKETHKNQTRKAAILDGCYPRKCMISLER